MSSIPNLLSLRGSSRGGRGRSRGRGGGFAASAARDHDTTIQGTDTDAAVSRLSAVDVGFLDDPYAQYFVQSGPGPPTRRLPIINRGTYTRTTGLDTLVHTFLSGATSAGAERQIISLGAGTDTRSLRIFSQSSFHNITYHEMDFSTICTRKLNTVKATPLLRKILPDPSVHDSGSWHVGAGKGNQFWCHGRDLRDLATAAVGAGGSSSQDTSLVAGLRTDIPTLLISECCLCYLEVSEAKAVIDWFASRIPDLGLVLYEPISPTDAFGKTMVSNLASRGIVMPTLEAYCERGQQDDRLRKAGFEQVANRTVDEVWDRWVTEEEKERVNGLEGLDEVEEWKLLASHYIIVWGWRGLGFEAWHGLR